MKDQQAEGDAKRNFKGQNHISPKWIGPQPAVAGALVITIRAREALGTYP
jgi:hypothetical protein